MTTLLSRREWISRARHLGPAIRGARAKIEELGRLPHDLMLQLTRLGAFRLLVPKALGGLELPPIAMFRVLDLLAQEDGSTAMLVLLGNGGFFTSFLADTTAEKILGNPLDGPIGMCFSSTGRCVPVPGGFEIDGEWAYATGIQVCGWIVIRIAPASAAANGDVDPLPGTLGAFIKAGQWTVKETWDAPGLRGTGSHSFSLQRAFVPLEQTFVWGSDPKSVGELYHMPFAALMAGLHSAVPIGLGRSAVTAFLELRSSAGEESRTGSAAAIAVARAEALLRSARSFVVSTLSRTWAHVQSRGRVEQIDTTLLGLAACHAGQNSAKAVTTLCEVAGLAAVSRASALAQAFRDVHTATQHGLLNSRQYERIGESLIGDFEQSTGPASLSR